MLLERCADIDSASESTQTDERSFQLTLELVSRKNNLFDLKNRLNLQFRFFSFPTSIEREPSTRSLKTFFSGRMKNRQTYGIKFTLLCAVKRETFEKIPTWGWENEGE